jgi:heme-degrading monooxygenase HmoA
VLSGLSGHPQHPDDSLGIRKESLMFARKVSVRLKSDAAGEFIQKMEGEIIPLLRKQKGFLDELTLISQGGKEIYAYSFWETSEDAERYDRSAFKEVTGLLNGVIEGAVRIHTYMVANSTFHKIAAAAAAS